MTTHQAFYPPGRNPFTSHWRALFLLVLLALAAPVFLLAAGHDNVSVPVDVEVAYTEHAEKHLKHEQIRRCLEDNGAVQVWRSRSWRDPYKFFRTCALPDGRIGVQIVRWSRAAGVWKEVTSFVVKDGRAEQVVEYLKAIAEQVK